MHCNVCGHENPDGSNFCSSCGAALRGDDTTVTFVTTDDDDGEVEVSLPLGELAPDEAILVVTKGPNAGSRYMLDKETTRVGRHPDSEIFLDDVTVSRRHAEFSRHETDFSIKDAGSLNGTYVNRERVDAAELDSGDEVQIGKFRMVFYKGTGGD